MKLRHAYLLTIALLFCLVSCAQQRSNKHEVLDIDNFERMINTPGEKIILDVRTPEEFAKGHLPDAVLMNIYDEDFNEQVKSLDKLKPVFVYCATGIRSNKASTILTEEGFEKVYHMKDGIKKWTAAKKPVIK